MNLIITLLVTPAIAVLVAVYVGGLETIIQVWDERKEKRNKRKKLESSIRAWKKIALEKHPVNNAVERGYAVARMLNCMHELNLLSRKG